MSLHKLTQFICKEFFLNNSEKENLDKIIRTYMRERAEWLKGKRIKPSMREDDLVFFLGYKSIDQAFDLHPSEEENLTQSPLPVVASGGELSDKTSEEEKPKPEYCKCPIPMICKCEQPPHCLHCGRNMKPLKPAPSLPALPRHIELIELTEGQVKINALITWADAASKLIHHIATERIRELEERARKGE